LGDEDSLITKLTISDQLQFKLNRLKEVITEMGQVLIAYSGGVDSTVLLKIAHEVLGSNAQAAIVNSESFPQRELNQATEIAKNIGIILHYSEIKESDNINIISNPPDRCYHCKTGLFSHLKTVACDLGISYVLDGTIADDLHDYRPGLKAKEEIGIQSPLADCNFSKNEIRQLAQVFDLPNWNKPSFACLNSRIPYGEVISEEKLSQIDDAENYLLGLGFSQVRVRHHSDLARIEVLSEDFREVLIHKEKISEFLKKSGFLYVTLDLVGYRTGSMNESL